MQKILLSFSLIACLSGCSLLSVYKIDIPQGTPLTQEDAKRVKIGMTKDQVTFLLGSPAIKDPLASNQWDYVYDFTPGTYGKAADIPATHQEQLLSIMFDANDTVIKIHGLSNIPVKQHSIPSAKK